MIVGDHIVNSGYRFYKTKDIRFETFIFKL